MSEDPVYGKEDPSDENDWRQSCQQARQSHACRALTIDHPDQTYPHDK